MSRLLTWLDDRTGIRDFTRAALYEHIPGGARWRYVWGSTLVFAFVVQMVTGFVLWMHYSPSSQTAWESVYYIQHEMSFGWLLRGIHHYTAQLLIILLAFHMLQVIIDGAYRAPREVNFWLGLILLNITLGLSLTGYLLPWDQKGYWSTKVATSLMGVVPGVGPVLQRLVVGGPEYGHHTLTRFFALHAGLLPLLMIVFTALHVAAFRRHGLTAKLPKRSRDSFFWPDQVLRDAVACLAVLLFVLFLCVRFQVFGGGAGHLGADLGAPADPAERFDARPEWYFLFLFQFLKLPFFAGHAEVYGAVVIPGIIMGILFLMPLIGRWRVGHWFNVGFTVFLAAGMVLLTVAAIVEDSGRPHVNLPLLGRLGPWVNIGILGLMLVATLVLIPLFVRERSFKFNVITLGALIVLIAIGVGMVLAGGGAALEGPRVLVREQHRVMEAGVEQTIKTFLDVQQALLLTLLGALAVLVTVVLFRDYPHASEVAAAGNGTSGRSLTRGDAPVAPRGAADRIPEGDAVMSSAPGAERAALLVSLAEDRGGPDDDGEAVAVAPRITLRRWELHHRLRLAMLLLVFCGTVFLAAISLVGGEGKPDFAAAVAQSHADAQRVVDVARGPRGIPPEGAVTLLRDDAKTQGPRLFKANCAACHPFNGHDGTGVPLASDAITAPDLGKFGGFASRKWIEAILDPRQVDGPDFFGKTAHLGDEGEMVDFVEEDVAEFDADQKAVLAKVIVAVSAEAGLKSQREADLRDAETIKEGHAILVDNTDITCVDCHKFHDSGRGRKNSPDLTGYGSRQWLIDFIKNPAHPRFYGIKNDRMPQYGEKNILDERSIGMVADWLRGEWYEPG